MAVRPVFVVSSEENCFVQKNIQFEFFSGFSETQKQKLAQFFFEQTFQCENIGNF